MSTVMAGAETLVDPTLWRQVVRLTLILFTAFHFVVVGPSPVAAQTETATGLSVPLDKQRNPLEQHQLVAVCLVYLLYKLHKMI